MSSAAAAVATESPPPRDDRAWVVRFFGIFADPGAWGAFLYLLLSLATGIFYFTWVTTGISMSLGFLVLIIGLPLAVLFLLSVRGISLVEGRIVEALLGVRMPRRPVFTPRQAGWWRRFKDIVTDERTWLSSVYLILQLPLGILYFTVLITLVSLSLYGIASPVLPLGFDLPVYNINSLTSCRTGPCRCWSSGACSWPPPRCTWPRPPVACTAPSPGPCWSGSRHSGGAA